MKKNKKTLLALIIIGFTFYTFINQLYLAETNKILETKMDILIEETEIKEIENNDLENQLVEKETKLTNVLKKQIQESSQPIASNIIRKLENNSLSKHYNSDKKETTAILSTEDNLPKEKIKIKSYSPGEIENNPENLNILLLGINSRLTDTILVASINEEKEEITLISIPRDYWINKYKSKINSLYVKHGFDALKESVESILGFEIHRHTQVYFEGFEKIIDHIGGIWIYNSDYILDKRFPTKDYRYETFELGTGYQNLDGETTLKFARTRHGDSDFARARRQQEVLNGIYNTIKKIDFTDINLILNVTKELLTFIKTDIGVFEGLKYFSTYKNYKLKTGNVLKVPTHLYSDKNYYGQYIVLPRDPSMRQIHEYVNGITK